MQGLVDCREDLGSYLRGDGSPGGLWVKEGQDLTLVVAGALWWLLQEGQTMGHGQGRGSRLKTTALVQVGDDGAEPKRMHKMRKKL